MSKHECGWCDFHLLTGMESGCSFSFSLHTNFWWGAVCRGACWCVLVYTTVTLTTPLMFFIQIQCDCELLPGNQFSFPFQRASSQKDSDSHHSIACYRLNSVWLWTSGRGCPLFVLVLQIQCDGTLKKAMLWGVAGEGRVVCTRRMREILLGPAVQS